MNSTHAMIIAMLLTTVSRASLSAEPTRMEWKIGDVMREALIFAPSEPSSEPRPLMFAFHGHGGNMRNAARTFDLHHHWPEAVTVYMQGLPTPGMTDPEGKRNGWQKTHGDQADRDLLFFDEVLKTMKQKYPIDTKRIYSTGHSNGGGFTYLLWLTRHHQLAAVAPSAAGARNFASLKPLPCFHIAGKKDTVVPFHRQEQAMEMVRRINGCVSEGTRWAEGCIQYVSEQDAPFVSFIHDGTHKYSADAPALIVKFFQEHSRKPK